MSKYDKMIALNKKSSEEKIDKAVKAVHKMMEDREKVTIPKLMNKTGLSRGFFYKNPAVRKEIDRALEQQAGMVDLRREVMDMAMNSELAMLHKQVEELKAENERLRQELAATKKSLVKKNVGILKKMV